MAVTESVHSKYLAENIKKTHAVLRSNVRNAGESNFEEVWKSHKSNQENLQNYADAMEELSKLWTGSHPVTGNRIEWCRNICNEYFKNGGIENVLRKDSKRLYYQKLRDGENTDSKTFEEFYEEQNQRQTCFFPQNKWETKRQKEMKIKLLDVGSCFNPFCEFRDIFDVLAIDLCPAKYSGTYQGDFLEIRVKEKQIKLVSFISEQCCGNGEVCMCNNSKLDDFEKDVGDRLELCLEKPVNELPGEHFDVVVFSLLLTYLPMPRLRWECCMKANKLLATQGLLFIIEPDSAHQQRNSRQIRAWKEALESIGFMRYKYEKLEHLHCMAFRKTAQVSQPPNHADMMYIPQDKQDETEAGESFFEERDEVANEEVSELFAELPEF
eukprot:gene6090-6793_t